MNTPNPPAPPQNGTVAINPNMPPIKDFGFKLRLANGQEAEGGCQAFNHIDAVIKLTAWLVDQPFAPTKITIVDRTAHRIVPATAILPSPIRP